MAFCHRVTSRCVRKVTSVLVHFSCSPWGADRGEDPPEPPGSLPPTGSACPPDFASGPATSGFQTPVSGIVPTHLQLTNPSRNWVPILRPVSLCENNTRPPRRVAVKMETSSVFKAQGLGYQGKVRSSCPAQILAILPT